MKIFRFLLFSILILFQGIDGSQVAFSLMTWNILGPNSPDTDLHFPVPKHMTWVQQSRHRLGRIVAEINGKMPDIVCLQEASLRTHQWLKQAGLHHDYELGCFCPKGKFNGAIVLFHKHRFQALKSVPCSLADHGAAACVALKSKLCNAHVVACSVHISRGNGRAESQKGQRQIQECLRCVQGQLGSLFTPRTACILAGDFNTYYEEVLDYVDGRGFLGASWHMFKHGSFTATSPHSRMQPIADALKAQGKAPFVVRCDGAFVSIDHILFSNLTQISPSVVGNGKYVDLNVEHFTAPQFRLGQLLVQDVYPSDHLPVFATFQVAISTKSLLSGKNSSAIEKIKQYWRRLWKKYL